MYKILILAFLLLLFSEKSNAEEMNIYFKNNACIQPFYKYNYTTCTPLNFLINNIKFQVPANFNTDLASIPRLAWILLSPAHSSLMRPSIIHDWFYANCTFNRKTSDIIFYKMLLNEGVSKIRAILIYYIVRFFGGSFYNKKACDARSYYE